MGRFFHHLTRHRNGVHNMLHRQYRPAVAMLVHDTGIQGHVAVPIGPAAEAHGLVIGVGLFDHDALLHGVESVPSIP